MTLFNPPQSSQTVQAAPADHDDCAHRLAQLFPGTANEGSDAELALWAKLFTQFPREVGLEALDQTKLEDGGRFADLARVRQRMARLQQRDRSTQTAQRVAEERQRMAVQAAEREAVERERSAAREWFAGIAHDSDQVAKWVGLALTQACLYSRDPAAMKSVLLRRGVERDPGLLGLMHKLAVTDPTRGT